MMTNGFIFQSTHPYGVRLDFTLSPVMIFDISIHAPVWGATLAFWDYDMLHEISIHAPVWGATLAFWDYDMLHEISIHAPVWGATLFPWTG